MITDASGRRIGGDGPTGREVHLVEVVKDGKPTWGLAPVGGSFDPLEVAAIMNQAALGIITKTRTDILEQQVKQKLQESLNKE